MKKTVFILFVFVSLFSCNDDTIDEIGVTISTEKIEAEDNAAFSSSFDIQTEGKWYVSEQIDWCTMSPTEGTGPATISVNADENTSASARSQYFHVFTSTNDAKIEVAQPGKYVPPVISELYLDLTGDLDYMQVANNSIFDIASDESFSIALKLRCYSDGRVIDRRSGSTSGFEVFVNTSGKLAMSLKDDSGVGLATNYTDNIIDGNWHHIAIVFNRTAGYSTVYSDGVEVGKKAHSTLSTSKISSTDPLLFGVQDLAGSNPFSGSIDDVSFYKKALTQDDVTAIINGDPVADQLFAKWNFNTILGSEVVVDEVSGLVGELMDGATLSLESKDE
ncbi:MAG: LamG-like jellyroll fold domain-containing protein [Draconibacterium sp.]